jgi:serine/threonine protein kinase
MDDMLMRLGAWRIDRVLGRDLSGTYYAGRREDGRRATLYLPSDDVTGARGSSLTRLLEQHRELAHPGLVRFHDVDHDHGDPFLIAGAVDDALVSLRSARRPDPGQTCALGAALASALAAAHDRGLVHGGLELDNVLWAPDRAPRILGLGAAVLGIADRDALAHGDVAALGRLLCVVMSGWQPRDAGESWAAADSRTIELVRLLADPGAAIPMREAYVLLAATEPTQTWRRVPGITTPPAVADREALPAGDREVPVATATGASRTERHGRDRADAGAVSSAVSGAVPGDLGGHLSRYRILTRLGRGGMGEVLLAEDPALCRGVAIKRIRPGLERDRTFRARLRREAQLAARLSHRAIVQVFDLVTHDNVDHVIMEYVPGPSLHTLLAGSSMAAADAVRIAAELADGLAYAHQQGVVHRDLKLENILIGTDGRPKIADFGIACRIAAAGELAQESLTRDGCMIGTSRAMSPEQVQGHDVDARSDLFSFGVMLYEMLTGESPFSSRSAAETVHRVLHHRPPSVRDLVPDVPRALSELVDHLLEKPPARRPDSAVAVRDRLRLLLDAKPDVSIERPARRPPSRGLERVSVTAAATGSAEYDHLPAARDCDTQRWLKAPRHPGQGTPATGDRGTGNQPPGRKSLRSKMQAPFVLAEIRALRSSIFKKAPEVQSALAIADKVEHSYDLHRSDLFIPAFETFCAILEPFEMTVLTGTLRRIGYEMFPQYVSILGIPPSDVKAAMQLSQATDLVRVICDAYSKCVVGTDAGTLTPRIAGTTATVTDTTFMPCQLQMGVFLGAGKLTGLFGDSTLTEKRCRSRGDSVCMYEFVF